MCVGRGAGVCVWGGEQECVYGEVSRGVCVFGEVSREGGEQMYVCVSV